MYQVLEAGKGGSLGALSSEGTFLASIPLTPTYITAYLVYGDSPTEVNMNLLSAFGLADEYKTALNNPDFYAGQSGGNAAMTYISLATFLKGIPNIRITPNPVSIPTLQSGGLFANRLVLTLPGIEVVGGSGQLTYIGTAGMLSQPSLIFGRGKENDPTLSYGTNSGKTDRNAEILRRNMANQGSYPSDTKTSAHHIVHSTHSYSSAQKAREILWSYGIDINAAENGIFVTRSVNSQLNSYSYMDRVLQALEAANSRDDAIAILRNLASEINLNYP